MHGVMVSWECVDCGGPLLATMLRRWLREGLDRGMMGRISSLRDLGLGGRANPGLGRDNDNLIRAWIKYQLPGVFFLVSVENGDRY